MNVWFWYKTPQILRILQCHRLPSPGSWHVNSGPGSRFRVFCCSSFCGSSFVVFFFVFGVFYGGGGGGMVLEVLGGWFWVQKRVTIVNGPFGFVTSKGL